MSERILHGLQKLELADVEGDGLAMPAVMTEAFRTYRDSVSFPEEDADISEEYSDQTDEAIIALATKGAKSIVGSTFDYSNETLQMLKGGTVLNGQWKEPLTMPIILKALRLTTSDGTPIECPKVQVFAKFNLEFRKKNVALLEFTFKPLAPFSFGTKTA